MSKEKITFERVHQLFKYDPETGNLIRKVTVNNHGARKGDIAGSGHGYLRTSIDSVKYLNHRLVWLLNKGYMPESDIDHIDKNPLNNKIENLREISHQCNLRNCGNFTTNKSGVKGVYFDKRRGKWIAYITVNYKRHHLCFSKSFTEAIFTRYAAEQCLDWQGCDSSSPAYKYLKERNLIWK